MATVLLLLDAFRHDYVNEQDAPFLWRCSTEGEYYAQLEQSLGFCERTEVLAGLQGDASGFFTAIGFDPEQSPYAGMRFLHFLEVGEKALLTFFKLLPAALSNRLHKRLRRECARRFKRRGVKMPPFLVPFSWLPFFALTEDRVDHREKSAFPSPSILSLLESSGGRYVYDTFTALGFESPHSSDADRLAAVIDDVAQSPKDLYLIYISAPDAWGHRLGPDAASFRDIVRRLDDDLARFVKEMEKSRPGNRFIFLGDHGMHAVKKTIDMEAEIAEFLRENRLHLRRDVLYFLDSTMVRFWAMSDAGREAIDRSLISRSTFEANGWWMDDVSASRFHVPWPDRRYGDYLWVASPGVCVFPDFFHRLQPCKGMHGYDPSVPESQGFCIHWGAGIPPEKISIAPLSEVFKVLRRSLNV